MRRKVSLLLSNGHLDAGQYPLGFLGDEVELVVERQNGLMVNEAILLQSAGGSLLSKKGGDAFKQLIKKMTEK